MGVKLLLPVVLLAVCMLLMLLSISVMLSASNTARVLYSHTTGAKNRFEEITQSQSHVSSYSEQGIPILTATTAKLSTSITTANLLASNSPNFTTLKPTLSVSAFRHLPEKISPLVRHKSVSSVKDWTPLAVAPAITHYQRPTCSDKLCSQYLSASDQTFFHRCQTLSKSTDSKAQCRFMDGRGRDPVGLVSVPGAGNTWVRGLLEKATGVCTGAIYCDLAIRRRGFAGEYVHSGSVVVVKTHTSDFQWKGTNPEKVNHEDARYGSAILLVRNPFDTFVAEWNRMITLSKLGDHGVYHPPLLSKLDEYHVQEFGTEYFGNNSDWNRYLYGVGASYGIGERWKKTIDKWFLHAGEHPIMMVRFEDIKKDNVTEVKRMLDFLNFTYTTDELRERLAQGYTEFRRKHVHREGHMDHYTPEQIKYVNSLLQQTILLLQKHGAEHLFRLHEYYVVDDII